MRHKRPTAALGALGACALALAAWFTTAATGSPGAVTVIKVTAGRPTELAFTLSTFSNLTPGSFAFEVTNAGAVEHAFKICTVPTRSGKANSCLGRATKALSTGRSQTIHVVLKQNGRYEYLCPVPGHAGAGMKGVIGVGVKIAASASPGRSRGRASRPMH